jgi:hypothetical protein
VVEEVHLVIEETIIMHGNCENSITECFIIFMWFQVMDNYANGRPSVMKTTRLLLDEDGRSLEGLL